MIREMVSFDVLPFSKHPVQELTLDVGYSYVLCEGKTIIGYGSLLLTDEGETTQITSNVASREHDNRRLIDHAIVTGTRFGCRQVRICIPRENDIMFKILTKMAFDLIRESKIARTLEYYIY